MLNDLGILLGRSVAHADPAEVVRSLTRVEKTKSKVWLGFCLQSACFLKIHVQQQLTEENQILSGKAQVKPAVQL